MPGGMGWESMMGMGGLPMGAPSSTRVMRFGNSGSGFTITMSSGPSPFGSGGSMMYGGGPPMGGPMGMPMGMGMGGDLHSVLQHIRMMLEQSGYDVCWCVSVCAVCSGVYAFPWSCECVHVDQHQQYTPSQTHTGLQQATWWRAQMGVA